MNAAMAKATMFADYKGLNGLQLEARKGSPESLRKAANKFEAIFVE